MTHHRSCNAIALCVGLLILFSSHAHALKRYYSLSKSIRALAMGNAFYGLSDDEYALFYNPAGLSVYRGSAQSMLSISAHVSPDLLSAVDKLTGTSNSLNAESLVTTLEDLTGKPLFANVGLFFPYYVRKNIAVGLLLFDVKTDAAVLGRDFETSLSLTAISDSGLFVGYGHSFLEDKLHVGATLKGVFRVGGKKTISLLDMAKSSNLDLTPEKIGGMGGGIDLDIGGMYEIPDLPFGRVNRVALTFNNLIGSSLPIKRVGTPPSLPRMVTLSAYSVFDGWTVFDNFHVVLDFAEFKLGGGQDDPEYGARVGSFWKHVNIGVEAPIHGWFCPRIGIFQGYFTAGFGVNVRAVRLDFATYTEEVSSSPGRMPARAYALRMQFGWGSSSPPPVGTIIEEKTEQVIEDGTAKSQKEQKDVDKKAEEKPGAGEKPGAEQKPATDEKPVSPSSNGSNDAARVPNSISKPVPQQPKKRH